MLPSTQLDWGGALGASVDTPAPRTVLGRLKAIADTLMALFAEKATWSTTATSTANAAAAITLAATPGQAHHLSTVAAGFDSTKTTPTLLTVQDGAAVIFQAYVATTDRYHFPVPIRGTVGQAMAITLGAGGFSSIGRLSAVGYTKA